MKLNLSQVVGLRPAARRGMALVITLIMLSVTLVMAIAFLAVSNRERVAVTTSADQANARLATDSALAAAQAQILANVLGSPGGTYNFSLIVSTNYINAYGFVVNSTSPTNVNFDYRAGATSLQPGDFEANVANLLYLPRVPVLVSAAEPTGRFYLDLNRNGAFDDTSSSTNTSLIPPSMYYVDGNGITNLSVANPQVGDPQWIGALERPDVAHSPDNKFVYRYAFMAVPIGNGLDLNYIHNQVLNTSLVTPNADGYFRNQGVGSWELNLAAFLTDLNTNQWDPSTDLYQYQQPFGSPNRGTGFEDAFSLLSWRYNRNYNTLAAASLLFNDAALPFQLDNIDEYGDGVPQLTTTNVFENLGDDKVNNPWAGADSTNRFFNLPSELFDPTKSSPNFVTHLTGAGTNLVAGAHPTYDRYTYYRMLDQLGTDSEPDDLGKLDLNYDNTDGHGNIVRNGQTNLIPWTPLTFFTNAANRLLLTYTTNWFQSSPSNYLATYYNTNYNYYYTYFDSSGNSVVVTNDPNGYGLTNVPIFGITNQIPAFGIMDIPVYFNTNFVYSSAVNRVLQMAANIYDASTNSFYSSVFRPLFGRSSAGNIFITGFTNVVSVPGGTLDVQLATPFDVLTLASLSTTFSNVLDNVYGVPWIVGAKKYMPSFNQLYTQNAIQVTRKIQVFRDSTGITDSGASTSMYHTNQLYIMSVTNHVGYSLWNSYTTNYPGNLPTIVVFDHLSMLISNAQSYVLAFTNFPYVVTSNTWPGSSWVISDDPNVRSAAPDSFVFGGWDFAFQPEGYFQFANGTIQPSYLFSSPWITTETTLFNLPQMNLWTTNYVQAYILDKDAAGNNHVIDYVQLNGPGSIRNLNTELLDPYPASANNKPYPMWVTNGAGTSQTGPPVGVINQLRASQSGPGAVATGADGWHAPSNTMPMGTSGNPQYEADYFRAFFAGNISADGYQWSNNDLTNQAPYTPTRTMYDLTLWQANDPLVHYLSSDLTESNSYTGLHRVDGLASSPVVTVNQSALGHSGTILGDDRYQPWGRISQFLGMPSVDTNRFNLGYKDPLVYGSDNWDFPNNRYPTVGWLGRVHRGTPWQTVYLKATNILALATPQASGIVTWMDWSGNGNSFDAINSAPAQDDVLFDVFTTALDDSASRGTLSVNQQHLAAWSAVLSGLDLVANATANPYFTTPPLQTNVVINPGGVDTTSPVWQMVEGTNGINAIRNQRPSGVFSRPGDIVLVPALTERLPFLANTNFNQVAYDVSDEMYEQIPQKIMGLLRVGSPRYVIYCYGQALRPAQDGTALDLTHNGLVTNYQVVAESAARAVVSVHPQVVFRPPTQLLTNYTTTVESYNLLPPD